MKLLLLLFKWQKIKKNWKNLKKKNGNEKFYIRKSKIK